LRRAAAEAGVPPPLLLAVVFAESRFTLLSPFRRRSWIQLMRRDAPAARSRSIARGAALIGVPAESVAADPALGLRAAAALLASAAREVGVTAGAPLDDWRAALVRFSGGTDPLASELYADQVMAILAAGFQAEDDDGKRTVQLPRTDLRPPAAPGPRGETDAVGAAFARFVPAGPRTHRDPASGPRRIRAIVIHTTEGQFSGTVQHVRKPTTEAASHYLVRSWDGLTLQLVDERQVAFHSACFNDESIGIEHEGFSVAGRSWYGEAMYRASARLVADIAARHDIPLDRQHILGHGETGGCSDHVDPGPHWDWDRFLGHVVEAARAIDAPR
jgi:N-acetylmuramoyl-L-alanine amidase